MRRHCDKKNDFLNFSNEIDFGIRKVFLFTVTPGFISVVFLNHFCARSQTVKWTESDGTKISQKKE